MYIRTQSLRPNLILLLACLLAVALFLLGVSVPQAHFWGSFLLPIMLVFLWGRRRDIYVITALASVLMFVEYWAFGATSLADLLVNHVAPIFIFWTVAWLLVERRQLQEQLALREQELDAQVTVRTTALKAREEQLAKIFDANPGGIAITRQSDGSFVEANDAYLAMVGYTREQLVGRSLIDLGLLSAAALDQVRAVFRERGSIRGLDLQLTNSYGAAVDILYSLEQIEFDGEACYLGLTVDVTERKAAERERLFLSALVASSPDAVVGRTVDGTILSWNRGAEGLFGYTAAEAVGKNLAMLAAPGTLPQMEAVMAEVAQGNAVEGVETQRMAKDGRVFDCRVSSFPVRDAAGDILGVASFTHDISQRKAAERALRASEERFTSLFNSSPVGLAFTRLSSGLFREANAAFLAMVGYSYDEVIGRTSLELGIISPADRARLATTLQGQGSFRGVDITLRTRDGELLNTLFSVDLMDCDGDPWMLSSIVDITERRRLEDALAANEAELRAVIENTADAVWSVDRRYCLLVANSVFGRSVEQQIGRPLAPGECVIDEPFPPDERAFWRTLYDRALAGESFMVEIPAVLPAGGTFACYLNPIYAGDTIAGVSARAADITDLKRYEQFLQDANAVLEQRVTERTADLAAALAEVQRASQLKDEFMAMISHELRTPLTGVLSMSEMLEEQVAGPLNARQAFYVKNINQSGERLLNVIDGILSYTHLLSGKVRLDAEPCELANLLASGAAALGHKAAAKRQTIAVEVTPSGLTVTSDATALAEVLKRLLDNAVKFTADGGQIGLAAHPGAAPGTVDLVVWDTGSGIAAGQLDQIFKPFTQADASLARSHEGIGLGLAYVDQMVRLLGGTLAIASTPGTGSRFTITLPA